VIKPGLRPERAVRPNLTGRKRVARGSRLLLGPYGAQVLHHEACSRHIAEEAHQESPKRVDVVPRDCTTARACGLVGASGLPHRWEPQVLERIRAAMGESLWDYELMFNSDFPVRSAPPSARERNPESNACDAHTAESAAAIRPQPHRATECAKLVQPAALVAVRRAHSKAYTRFCTSFAEEVCMACHSACYYGNEGSRTVSTGRCGVPRVPVAVGYREYCARP
jgi:hypothetical protein